MANRWGNIGNSDRLYLGVLIWGVLLWPIYWVIWKKVKVTQSCPTLGNPMDYSVHGILLARILEWVAFPFSRGSSQSRDRIAESFDGTQNKRRLCHRSGLLCKLLCHLGHVTQEIYWSFRCQNWRGMLLEHLAASVGVTQIVKNLPTMWETQVQSLGREDPLEKGMTAHSSILAWRIPWIGKPGSYCPWDHKESYVTFAFA